MLGDKLTATLTIGIGETNIINLESNGNDITDEYMKNEFQEDTSKGGINNLLKNIISMQQVTNITLTEFVNKEKSEKLASLANDPTTQTKSKKQQSKEKQQLKQQQNQNKKRVENSNENGTNDDDEKIVKQQKLE